MIKRTPPLIVGNWKATPGSKDEAVKFIKTLEKKIISSKIKLPKKCYYLAVPEIFIPPLALLSKRGHIGSETVHGVKEGQETGATTARQLLSGGADFTLVAHSEVRKRGEKEEERALKVEQSLTAGLTTILCLGEKVRDKEGTYLEELETDIKNTLHAVKRESFGNLIVAYEPVWAIGAAVPATANECFEAVIAIRRALASLAGIDYAKKVHILYGGTVTKDTATSFLQEGGVNGLLVGRASQEVVSFFEIITSSYTGS
ncbi:MAG: triose-phosphate isomerase [Candidatus Pacebacteria bacterium]|nr:triose-phosphate isomerase [Candidatus Paceibacterota bacterium]